MAKVVGALLGGTLFVSGGYSHMVVIGMRPPGRGGCHGVSTQAQHQSTASFDLCPWFTPDNKDYVSFLRGAGMPASLHHRNALSYEALLVMGSACPLTSLPDRHASSSPCALAIWASRSGSEKSNDTRLVDRPSNNSRLSIRVAELTTR